MLECLLPQTELFKEKVEVIISDNCSTDDTGKLLKELAARFTFKSFRRSNNIGVIANIVQSASELASGEFIWLLGDHNLVAKGGIEHLVSVLEKNSSLDILYSNFRCAKYPEHWPERVQEGYDGPFDYYNKKDFEEYSIPKWHNLISGSTALCTQLYAHIVKSQIWKSYWKGRPIPDPYISAIGTYPHTYMLAQTVFNQPSYYIGRPLITIFNGAQHWGDLDVKAKVYTLGLPELIREFQKQKLASIKNQRGKEL
jgi:glycosyltransferase involved in cell wall biosynthesis